MQSSPVPPEGLGFRKAGVKPGNLPFNSALHSHAGSSRTEFEKFPSLKENRQQRMTLSKSSGG